MGLQAIASLPVHTSSLPLKKMLPRAVSINRVVSTDPPYYDNIGYADLRFYVWLRRSLRLVFPGYSRHLRSKSDELVATPYRHGGKQQAKSSSSMV